MDRDRFESVAKEWNFNPFIIDMFREFAEQFRNSLQLDKSMKLLDVGGGTGLIAFNLAPEVESVTIVDNSPAMVETARTHLAEQGVENVSILQEDILKVELPQESLDTVYGHMSFHHLEDLTAAFTKIHALLKPGGKLVIGDLCSEDGSFHGDEPVPHNGFDSDVIAKELLELGYNTVETTPLKELKRPDREEVYERFFLVATK